MKFRDMLFKEMREVALQLPPINYTTREVLPISGKELLLTGITEVEGKPIDENQVYDLNSPVYHRFNHYRRMKRIYLRHEKHGHEKAYQRVKDYITACVNAAQISDDED